MRYIFPYIVGLATWIILALVVLSPASALWLLAVLIGLWMALVATVGRGGWYREWSWWMSVLIFFITTYGLVLVLVSPTVRNLYIVGAGVMNALLVLASSEYVHGSHRFLARKYLPVLDFICLVTFMQSAAMIFFFRISFGAKAFSSIGILTLIAIVVSRSILRFYGIVKSSKFLVLVVIGLTTAEFAFVTMLLPFHYYVLGALLASWYFFLIGLIVAGQSVTSRSSIFKRYSWLLISFCIALFITARWQ